MCFLICHVTCLERVKFCLSVCLKISLNYPKSAAARFFSKGLKYEFETAVVNEPSVFEPLKFSCLLFMRFYGVTVHELKARGFIHLTMKTYDHVLGPFSRYSYTCNSD